MHAAIEFAKRDLWKAEKCIDPKASKPSFVHIEVHPGYYVIVMKSLVLAFPNPRKCRRVTFGWIAVGTGLAETVEGLEQVSQQLVDTMAAARKHHDDIQARKAARAARREARR
jgi:hypothetical protein